MKTPKVSVIVPAYNEEKYISVALSYLAYQNFEDYEIIVVDDGSKDRTADIVKKFSGVKYVYQENSGPAAARNKGIKSAKAEIIAFTDADCLIPKDWVSKVYEKFKDRKISVVMGNTKIPSSNFFGDSVAALGFPGGANVGFENLWKVDSQGYTNHITSCNFAARKSVFEKYGGFDESFPLPGGEDPELSYRFVKKGIKIKYCPDVLLYHAPCTKLKDFIRWHYKRGVTNYFFKRKVGKVENFVSLRLWSSWNIVKKYFLDVKLGLIMLLLALSFVLQQLGYLNARIVYD